MGRVGKVKAVIVAVLIFSSIPFPVFDFRIFSTIVLSQWHCRIDYGRVCQVPPHTTVRTGEIHPTRMLSQW
jgi:hypothetical protein